MSRTLEMLILVIICTIIGYVGGSYGCKIERPTHHAGAP